MTSPEIYPESFERNKKFQEKLLKKMKSCSIKSEINDYTFIIKRFNNVL